MKKIVIMLLAVLELLTIINYVNAKEFTKKDILPYVYPSIDEEKRLLNKRDYTIVFDDQNIKSKLSVYEYVPEVGDYISLREFVEAFDGEIQWEPNYENKYLGKFQLMDHNYKFFSHFSYDGIDDQEVFFPIDLYMDIDEKEVNISMHITSGSMYCKYVDGTIYIQLASIKKLLPRMGCTSCINKDSKTIKINKYNVNKEKNLMISKFPEDIYGKSFYNKEYENYYEYDNIYYCTDMFDAQIKTTITLENRYCDYIDRNFKFDYVLNKDNKEFFKNLLRACYLNDLEGEEVFVDYDSDLDAYIISNNDEYTKISDGLKVLVIRASDNMVLFQYY